MPLVTNLAGPQDSGPAKMAKKCSMQALRNWYGKRARSVAQKVRRFMCREPQGHAGVSQQARRDSSHHESRDISKGTEPARAMSTVSSICELDSTPDYAYPSTISLASTRSTGTTARYMRPTPQPQPLPRLRPRALEDLGFHFPWDDDQGEPTIASPGKQLPRSQSKTFEIDSTSPAAAQEQPKPKPPFRTYPGSPIENGPAKLHAYARAPQQKPSQAHYIPPALQPGFINGIPPALRAKHSTASFTQAQNEHTQPGAATPEYSYPLVDFRDGLFLNANMSDANISSRYQEPRIPAMQFPSRGLQDDFNAELTRLRIPDEKQIVLLNPRAWMSPGSPLHENAYEMEASLPGYSVTDARMVHYPETPQVKKRELSTFSPVSPLSSDAGTAPSREYSWPRFSDPGYTDPAEEYSRNYRQQRRDLWRGRSPD